MMQKSMNRVFLFTLTAAVLFVLPAQAEDPIRILTINVRLAMAKDDGENAWKHRKEFLSDLVAAGNYDFIGTQETVLHPTDPERNQVQYLISKMPNHAAVYRSREKDPKGGESMMILYKKERWRMDKTDNGTFWISGTPDVPGSKADGTARPRSVTFGLFHELKKGKPTGRKIYVYDTHYDHQSEYARQLGAKIAMDRIAARKEKNAPVVIMGDLNCGEKSPAIRYMQGEPMTINGEKLTPPCKLVDTFRAVNPDAKDVGTYHAFKTPRKDKIDFIFVSESVKTVSSRIIRDKKNDRYPTDHFPVEAVIQADTPAQSAAPKKGPN